MARPARANSPKKRAPSEEKEKDTITVKQDQQKKATKRGGIVGIKTTIFLVFLSAISPLIYDRYQSVSLLMSNDPSKLEEVSKFSSYKVEYEKKIRNCEDIVLDEEKGIAFLSCDPGRDVWNTVMGEFVNPNVTGAIHRYNYGGYSSEEELPVLSELELVSFPNQKYLSFHPLGIEYYAPSRRLFVVNHQQPGSSIEVFDVSSDASEAHFVQTIQHPLIKTPNSILALSDHELIVTNDHYFRQHNSTTGEFIVGGHSSDLAFFETYSGLPGGTVVYHDTKTGEARILARAAFANGIAMLDAHTVAVAATATPGVKIFDFDPATKALTLRTKFRVPFWVDNLSVDARGTLLLAGHPYPPALEKVARWNKFFDLDGTEDYTNTKRRPQKAPVHARVRSPSYVAEWTEKGGLKPLFVGHAKEYGCSSTAVRDVKRKKGIVVGLYEAGILTFKD